MFQSNKSLILGLILATGMVLSSYTISKFYLKLEKDKLITVKGYAQQRVRSDIGEVRVGLRVQAPELPAAHEQLKAHIQKVTEQILSQSIKLTPRAGNINVRRVYQKNKDGKDTNTLEFFALTQTLTVKSSDVEALDRLATGLSALLAEGIELDVNGPDYTLANLDQYKLDLIARATENGFERARIMAEKSGGRVAKLLEAQQGVFQITPPDSTETSSYGQYDTTTIDKDMKAVVTLKYSIE